ncbi:MAG: SCO family protein [Acidobacteria bacterium]|nr:SCO family protein [Acidobacteriota bacterium]
MRSLALFLLVAVAAAAQNAGPATLKEIGIDQKLNSQAPLNLPFRDETGRSVRLGDYFGQRPVILSLVYYECPMLCTLVLNGLVQTMRELPFTAAKQFEVVTVSFNPHETPELAAAKKRTYLQDYTRPGAERGWHFLTGDEPSIAALTTAVGFRYKYDPATRQYGHATAIIVLTPEGRVSRYFYGIEYPEKDVRLALVEASHNRIGTPVDQLLLLCFHYDPATGKYGLAILNATRALGAATVLGLVFLMTILLRREGRVKG